MLPCLLRSVPLLRALPRLGAPLRRIWQELHQEVQGLSRRMGAACQTARLPQDVWPPWSLLRKRPDAQVHAGQDGGDQVRQLGEQSVG
jgi:hypothetical protein